MMRGATAATIILALAAWCSAGGAAVNPATDNNVRIVLNVQGEATAAPTSTATSSPTGSPNLVQFAGTLRCTRQKTSGTGMFRGRGVQLCAQARAQRSVLRGVDQPNTRLCSQIYSGPQHATITGRVGARTIDISIERSDGCGTADWTKLQWLLGPPVR